ncbi:hypothetical protein [Flaviaesturariibacter aridisoli]|uniref:Uncharacterized protein n=1 Tax=Flaviaesturariibacter aridisoli TaxID=2545761 RepID=A0A4R4E0X9_9BACT|nr:hypothetical protein [Flaviaesturariibacter aridisoli]TCZ71782.1 hypothetical protein E0486_09535 [Flaviaesturariibacter aridisoli]
MSNLTANRVNHTFTQTEIDEIKQHFTAINRIMGPKLIGLTKDERRKLPKMYKANLMFMQDAQLVAEHNPDLFPAYFNADAMRTDEQLHLQMKEIGMLTGQLHEKVMDTGLLAGSEAYVSALAVYRMAQAAAKAGVAGAKALADKLAERFQQASDGEPEEMDGNQLG